MFIYQTRAVARTNILVGLIVFFYQGPYPRIESFYQGSALASPPLAKALGLNWNKLRIKLALSTLAARKPREAPCEALCVVSCLRIYSSHSLFAAFLRDDPPSVSNLYLNSSLMTFELLENGVY